MERGTILVVDDEPNIAELIELYLSREGFRVVKKATGTDKDKIIDVMHKSAVPGLLIPEYKFDENGDVINGPLYIYTVEKGAFKVTTPSDQLLLLDFLEMVGPTDFALKEIAVQAYSAHAQTRSARLAREPRGRRTHPSE